tara:strand:- start:499 stop:882 length:384 start_codon:yes stop_codon:yes gene_type:complete
MRLMGIDYGSKRVGVALTDETGVMAFPLAVYKNDSDLVTKISKLAEEEAVAEIVIGHSLNREGEENEIHKQVEELITDLTLELGLPIHLESEQYTTQEAIQIQGRNDMVDASAAAIILNSYISKSKQ